MDYIISLVSEFVQDTNVGELNENNIKVFFIGDISKFQKETQEAMRKVVDLTEENTGLKVYFAMNYGGKSDIIQAVKSILKTKKGKKLQRKSLNSSSIQDRTLALTC